MPNPPPITPVLLVFISDKQALVVMRSSMAKVFFMGRWGYGIDPQSHKPCKACFVFEGFSEDHFSMVEIDNATGIFQYHEVAFVGEASYENFYMFHSSYKVASFIGF
ncbi:hypothetical protein Tco_1252390 [Tanacetum coccineum]